MNVIIKKLLPHLAAILLMLVLVSIYFLPQLEGKVVQQSDLLQYRGMTQEILDVAEKSGEKPLWTNSMFGGMPAYQINTPPKGNFLYGFDVLLRLGLDHPIGIFFASMLCFYILMVSLGVNPWLSLAGAIAFGFTTNSFTLYEAGHITKLRAISYFPLIAAGMILSYRGKYLWGGLIFAAGLGLNIMANHVQMSYYLFLTLPFFALAELVKDIREKQLLHFGKATGVLLLGGLFAIGASTANLWTTYEYSRDTMRGKPVLEQTAEAQAQPQAQPVSSSSTREGLAWDYAMQWSNGAIDLVASFIPGAAGGGSGGELPTDSRTYQDLMGKGANPGNYPSPYYWGALPFTSGPIYFGAVVVFLFLLGLYLVPGPTKWWIGLGALLTLMLSMGKNLAWFNEFFYNVVPLYNKFRTPNSVLSITSFLLPVLGVLAIHRMVKGEVSREEALRGLYISGGISAGLALIFWLMGPSLFAFTGKGDAQYQQAGWDLASIIADRKGLLQSDSLRSFAFVVLSGGLIWFYLKNRIQATWMVLGLALLTLVDLWLVDRRYLDYDSFVDERNNQAFFQPRPVDEEILRDPDPNFRVFDVADNNTFNSARYAYFHKMIGGYHAAKLQRYQDIIDRHLSRGNRAVIDMLNTRYFIVKGQDGQPMVQPNPDALGNAWFVDSIELVASANAEIDSLTNFNPANVAIIHQEFAEDVQGLDPSPAGSIELTDYRPDHLVYQANTAEESLAIFSEIWYGPNKGWKAYIDGSEVELIRANYILRALRVPAGQHKIELVFKPESFYTGRTLSNIFSGITVLGLLGFIGYNGYQLIQNPPVEEPKAPRSERPAPVQKTAPVNRNTGAKQKKKR